MQRRGGTDLAADGYGDRTARTGRVTMGKGLLMWLIGIPIPIIILLLIFWH
ncbi:MAG: hypothetical protein M3R41_05530 [Pseudomonadota bacterium]|nr:hypothetical protein [Pseudomonadota bacterium]